MIFGSILPDTGLTGDPKPNRLTPEQIAAWNAYRKSVKGNKPLSELHKGYKGEVSIPLADLENEFTLYSKTANDFHKRTTRQDMVRDITHDYVFAPMTFNGKSVGLVDGTLRSSSGPEISNDWVNKLPTSFPKEYAGKLRWDSERGLPYYGGNEDGTDIKYVHPSAFYSQINQKYKNLEVRRNGKQIQVKRPGTKNDWITPEF